MWQNVEVKNSFARYCSCATYSAPKDAFSTLTIHVGSGSVGLAQNSLKCKLHLTSKFLDWEKAQIKLSHAQGEQAQSKPKTPSVTHFDSMSVGVLCGSWQDHLLDFSSCTCLAQKACSLNWRAFRNSQDHISPSGKAWLFSKMGRERSALWILSGQNESAKHFWIFYWQSCN